MNAPINVGALRIRIPVIDYTSDEFEYLTPVDVDEYDEDEDYEYQEEEEISGGHVRQVDFNEDEDDPFQTVVKRFRTPTPHPEPPQNRSFAFYLYTGRINEILPSPPKFPVSNTIGNLVPSHMTVVEYWRTQLDLTELTEEDIMPPVDWIQTA